MPPRTTPPSKLHNSQHPLGRVPFSSYYPSITGITTSGFTPPNNLDDLAPAQAQVSGDGIINLDARKLRLLQAIAQQQPRLLLGTQQDMLGDQLVARDIDKQILFLKVFADATGNAAQEAHGRRRDGSLGDEYAGVEILLVDEMVEGADLLGSHAGHVDAEFDVDGAAVGLRVWVCFCR